MIEVALFEFLASQTELQALLGEATRTRFHPLILPDRTPTPAVVYRMDGTQRARSYCATDRVVRTRVQLDTYARNYVSGITVAAALRLVLVDFRGMMGTGANAVKVKDVSIDPNSDRDLEEPEPGLFRRWQDYTIWHVE